MIDYHHRYHLLCLQVIAPLQGALPQQTGVIIQPQQIVLASGNKVQGNTQVGILMSFIRTDVPCIFNIINIFSHYVYPDPVFKWHDTLLSSSPPQLFQAAAAIEQPGQAVAAAQVQQVQQAPVAAATAVPQAQPQPQAQRPPMMLQVDGTGDTSSEEEDEEEEYDEDDEEEKEKEAGEDWQVEEVCTERNRHCQWMDVAFVILGFFVCLFFRSH